MTSADIRKLRQRVVRDWGKKCKDFCWTCVVCQNHLAVDILEDNYRFIEHKEKHVTPEIKRGKAARMKRRSSRN